MVRMKREVIQALSDNLDGVTARTMELLVWASNIGIWYNFIDKINHILLGDFVYYVYYINYI